MIFKQFSSILLLMLMPMQTLAAFQPIFKISHLKLTQPLSPTCINTNTATSELRNTQACTDTKTSLHMKLTVNIEDLPEFDLPQNIFGPILDFIPSSDLTDSISLLELNVDPNSFSSLVSTLSSVVAVPPLGDASASTTTNNIADQLLIYSTTTGRTFDVMPQPMSSVATSAIVLSGLLFALSFPSDNFRGNHEPYERGNYDPQAAREYYAKHPQLVLRRLLQLVRIANKWIIRWLYEHFIVKDKSTSRTSMEKRRKIHEQRAEELLEIIQQIGPTAIKVGQALSVRPDLIPQVYTEKLSELQDNVPPFDSEEAKEVLINELGHQRFQLLKDFDLDNPVASASIGQVYKGVIKRGKGRDRKEVEVAIKVQRPNVLSEIALDLFLTRELAPLYQELTKNDTNLQKLADEWGRGFIAELTYTQEAKNTIHFNEEMKKKNMNAVCAPTVVEELSTNRVLATEWVNGIRLDKSGEEDVARLCGVALNAYLVMLLETGTLHCDPHPGNLLRTENGRLCILDFGMTIDTPEDLQYSLLEFIAHLTSENYDAIPQDLVNLQFIKQDKLKLIMELGLLDPMFYFFQQAAQGGGGSKVKDRIMDEFRTKYPEATNDDQLREYMRNEIKENTEKLVAKASSITGITMKIEDLQRENSDAFVIPEWFLYTSRAFLTLEGISLQSDQDYSIIKSCFPYIAKRLIGDNSPRSQAALKNMIYGKGEHLNAEKITELADGFTTYTTTTKIVSQNAQKLPIGAKNSSTKSSDIGAEAAITLAKDSADILLHPTGNLIQQMIVEESATALHANVKDTLQEIFINNPERLRANLPFGFLIPKFPVEQVSLFLRKSQQEEQVQTLLQKFPILKPPSPEELGRVIRSIDINDPLASLVDGMSAEEVALIWKAMRENAPVYAPRVASLSGKFASSIFEKVSEDIDSVINNTDDSLSLPDTIIRTSARGISAVAKAAARAGNNPKR